MTFFIQVMISGILIGGVYSLISLPIVMVYKSSKIFNFAQGGILMLGAWITWFFMDHDRGLGLTWWLAIILSLMVAVFLGFAIERFVLRRLLGQPIFSTMIATLGLGAIFVGIVAFLWGSRTGESYAEFIFSGNVQIGSIYIGATKLTAFIITMALIVLFIIFFQFHRYGLAMRAIAEDQQVAEALGIKVSTILQLTWVLACIITFLAGILLASISSVNHTLDSMVLICFVVILMGGLESIYGVLLAGPIIGLIEQLTAQYIEPYFGAGLVHVMPFLILIITVVIRPHGIFGLERIERI